MILEEMIRGPSTLGPAIAMDGRGKISRRLKKL